MVVLGSLCNRERSIMHMQRKSHTKPPKPSRVIIDAGKCGVSHASLEMQTEAAAERGQSWSS